MGVGNKISMWGKASISKRIDNRLGELNGMKSRLRLSGRLEYLGGQRSSKACWVKSGIELIFTCLSGTLVMLMWMVVIEARLDSLF